MRKTGLMLAALCAALAAHPPASAAQPAATAAERRAAQATPKGCEFNNIALEQAHAAAGPDSLVILAT